MIFYTITPYNIYVKTVVAPKYLHKYLLNELRKDDPFLDLSIISKEDLNRSINYSNSEDALLYLIKEKKYPYDIAKHYLEYLPYVVSGDNPKTKFLLSIKEELIEKGYLIEPIKENYSNIKVDVIGYYPIDFELIELFKELNIEYHFVNNQNINKEMIINNFEKIEDEVYFVLNEIASLIDKGEDIRNIYIFRRDENYDYYLNKFSKSFGYKINFFRGESLIKTGGAKRFFYHFDATHSIEESLVLLKEEMKDDSLYIEIEDLVNKYKELDLSFSDLKDYLTHKFIEKNREIARYDNAVNIIDKFTYLTNKKIFVLGFSQGSYPRSYKDDKYLNNEELHQINRLNSKDKTKIDEASLFDMFNSDNEFIYSFSKTSSNGVNYLSPLTKYFASKIINKKLDNVFYSSKVLSYIYSNLKDLEYFYKERGEDFLKLNEVISIDYNNYDNTYKSKVKAFNNSSKIRLSTTSLDLYSNCPFRYYLQNVIKLDEVESTYAMTLGKIAHHIFEHMRDENFDFERVFDEKVSEYSLKCSEKYVLTHNVKKQIKDAVDAILEREKYYRNPSIYNEKRFTYQINSNTELVGVIDNLVILDNKYYICIDYKTGSTKFDESRLEYGLSTQLPIYSLLVKEKYQDYQLIGLYINQVTTSQINVKIDEGELIPSYLKLNGKSIADIDKFTYIDPTIADKKSSFVNGVSLKADGSLKTTKSIASESEFEGYISTVKLLLEQMDKNLRNNNFEIHPFYLSERDNACSYCDYKDVCYVRKYQYRVVSKEEKENE